MRDKSLQFSFATKKDSYIKSDKLGKKPPSVFAVFKELAQHPPHTLFDMWNLFFDYPQCILGTLSPHEVVHNFSIACYARYLSKI